MEGLIERCKNTLLLSIFIFSTASPYTSLAPIIALAIVKEADLGMGIAMAQDSSDSQERRKFSRIAFDADTTLVQNERDWKVSLVDISLKGILIEAPQDFDINPDKPLLAKVQLDDVSYITMAIRFAHKEANHIGFVCTQIDIDSISHLRRLTELNLGSTDLLERELSALGCD